MLLHWPQNDDDLAMQLHLLKNANRRLDRDRHCGQVKLFSQRNRLDHKLILVEHENIRRLLINEHIPEASACALKS